MVKVHILNLEHNSSLYELDTLKQEQVKGGFWRENIAEGNGAKLSVTDRFSISVNSEVISDSNYKPFDFTFVLNRQKVDFNSDLINQVITSGNAQVLINGKEY